MSMSIREQRRVKANNMAAKIRLREKRAYRLRERGFSCKDIGQALGVSESYVRTIFSRSSKS